MNKKKEDITRIEDLSEFLHSENNDEAFPEPEEASNLSGDKTNPDIKIPEGFNNSNDDDFSSNFTNEELNTVEGEEFNSNDFTTDFNSEELPSSDFSESTQDFNSTDFGGDFNSDFENTEDSSDANSESPSDEFANNDNALEENAKDENTLEDFKEESFDFTEAPVAPKNKEASVSKKIPTEEFKTPPPPPTNSSTVAKSSGEASKVSLKKEDSGEIYRPIKSVVPKNDNKEKIQKTENFNDVKQFSNNVLIGDFTVEGNPPYSIYIKNIKFIEDIEAIINLLDTIGYTKAVPRENIEKSLKRGKLLISRLSEFSAIFICHKLRNLQIDIKMGLSDELHPPKDQEKFEVQVTKRSVGQNKFQQANLQDFIVAPEEILITTTPTLEGFKIEQYSGIVTHSAQCNFQIQANNESIDLNIDKMKMDLVNDGMKAFNPNKTSFSSIHSHYYEAIADQLKIKAAQKKANGLVGLTFQLIPIDPENYSFELLGSANAVWVTKIE